MISDVVFKGFPVRQTLPLSYIAAGVATRFEEGRGGEPFVGCAEARVDCSEAACSDTIVAADCIRSIFSSRCICNTVS